MEETDHFSILQCECRAPAFLTNSGHKARVPSSGPRVSLEGMGGGRVSLLAGPSLLGLCVQGHAGLGLGREVSVSKMCLKETQRDWLRQGQIAEKCWASAWEVRT